MPRSLTTHIDSPQQVGRRLREARERAGLSQRQLAFPGCTAAYISRLEAGARVPSLQMINQLALRLDVSGEWLATGVDQAPPEPLALVEAEVALRLGDLEEAERRFRAHLQPGDPARAAALAGLGRIALAGEQFAEAVELLEQAFAARRRRALVAPGVVEALGRAYEGSGARTSAIALYEAAIAEAAHAGAPVEEFRFSVLLADALTDGGDYERAGTTLAHVLRESAGLDDPLARARAFWAAARLHTRQHEPQLAGRYTRRALAILERTEHDVLVGNAYYLLAFADLESGNVEDALRRLEQGRELVGGRLSSEEAAKYSVIEARALAAMGRHEDAAREGARAVELVEALSPSDRGQSYVSLAQVLIAADDRDGAKVLLGKALDLLAASGPRAALEAARPLAELLEADGETAQALEVLKRAASAAAPARA